LKIVNLFSRLSEFSIFGHRKFGIWLWKVSGNWIRWVLRKT
jgi:hypothetical protein